VGPDRTGPSPTPPPPPTVPGLFLQDEVRLHEELDAEPQAARHHAVHLLADAVPQVQPQVLPHLTLLTLPTTGGQRDDQKKHQGVQNYLFIVVWLTNSSPCQLTLH